MEEDALKLVLDEDNRPVVDRPYLAREAGLSRYERILNYDFSAGDAYWEQTGAFWAQVRAYWDRLYAQRERFAFEKSVDGTPMFMALFAMADASAQESDGSARGETDAPTRSGNGAAVAETLEKYLKP